MEVLCEAIKLFAIDTVIVVGDDMLKSKLSSVARVISLEPMPKNRQHSQQQMIRSYFYGTLERNLSPASITYNFSDFVVHEVRSQDFMKGCLPIGQQADLISQRLLPQDMKILNHRLLYVIPKGGKIDEVPVQGCLWVSNVDTIKKYHHTARSRP